LIENTHTNITETRKNSKIIFKQKKGAVSSQNEARTWAHRLSIEEMISIVKRMDGSLRKRIREGALLNLAMAKHGETLFPKSFVEMMSTEAMTHSAGLVCCGVFARMSGEDLPVMSIAGAGNKGITCAIPILELERERKLNGHLVEEALALAALVSSKITEELGTLSAVCGCSNAAGIGLACALVYLMGGNVKQISYAINNMVGNVTGMICDGAKIGCALKTMTSVDAAFRSATLALNNLGIPKADGIVGENGAESLRNLGTIAKKGMIATDLEILKIMEEKLHVGNLTHR
jgi:L-cysteine desulfidase